MGNQTYVLVTAAYNEERFITRTIDAVVSQTVPPRQWVIVSDASGDRTDQIVESYAQRHSYIRLLRITEDHPRNFEAQVRAINLGLARLESTDSEFIGNLDADVSFGPNYFGDLLGRFESNPKLGLAGGIIQERDGWIQKPPRGEILRSVPHAVQLFRRACLDALGGRYRVLRYGGPDTYAELAARMKGWDVEGFPDLVVHHHRYMASAGGVLRGRFRQGLMDYSLGFLPVFECLRCARRLRERPMILGAVLRIAAYFWAYLGVRERLVPDEFVQFVRAEQQERMAAWLRRACHIGKGRRVPTCG
jgi:glycosyltransferase involved in cell wall biosynthesis